MLLAVVAVLTVLATLAVAAAWPPRVENRWQRQLAGVMTVRIPPVPKRTAASATINAKTGVGGVGPRAGIAGAVALDPARSVALLTPWLGAEVAANLPLARLIDIRLTAKFPLSARWQRRLRQVVPGAIVDDHRRWFKDVSALAKTIAAVGAAVLLVALATTAVIPWRCAPACKSIASRLSWFISWAPATGLSPTNSNGMCFAAPMGAAPARRSPGRPMGVTVWQTSAPRLGLADLGGTINRRRLAHPGGNPADHRGARLGGGARLGSAHLGAAAVGAP